MGWPLTPNSNGTLDYIIVGDNNDVARPSDTLSYCGPTVLPDGLPDVNLGMYCRLPQAHDLCDSLRLEAT